MLLSVLLFVVISIATIDLSGMSDGFTQVGFPLVFMQDTGGKCTDCSTLKWFKWRYLLIDLVFACILLIILLRIYLKIRGEK